MQPSIVLCLDDDEAMLRLLKMALEVNGDVALLATNGRQALQLAATYRLDAAVLDYGLPDMTGGEVATAVKQSRPDIPILMFSGASDIPPSKVLHVDAIVSKSKGVGTLLATLHRFTQRISAESPAAPR